jgi:hypothetical protein
MVIRIFSIKRGFEIVSPVVLKKQKGLARDGYTISIRAARS